MTDDRERGKQWRGIGKEGKSAFGDLLNSPLKHRGPALSHINAHCWGCPSFLLQGGPAEEGLLPWLLSPHPHTLPTGLPTPEKESIPSARPRVQNLGPATSVPTSCGKLNSGECICRVVASEASTWAQLGPVQTNKQCPGLSLAGSLLSRPRSCCGNAGPCSELGSCADGRI